MTLVHARLRNVSVDPAEPEGGIPVMFNPTEYTLTRNMSYPEVQVPGLSMPLLQFVRGESQTLSLELFLDQTDVSVGNAEEGSTINDHLRAVRSFAMIDERTKAPPVAEFQWGNTTFRGVVTQHSEKFTLFDEAGQILRARITWTLKSYVPGAIQYREQGTLPSEDVRTHVVQEGERLEQIAAAEYGDPSRWTLIAQTNGITQPRLLRVGQVLTIPPVG